MPHSIIEQLYIQHEQQMFAVAYSILKHPADAEDAVHQAFTVLLEKQHRLTLSDDDKTRALLMIITKHQALDMLRSRKKLVFIEDIDDTAPLLTKEEFDSLDSCHIREAVKALPEEVKHIITLRFVYGFTAEETAELTGLSVHAVYRRIRQARTLLSEYLEVK